MAEVKVSVVTDDEFKREDGKEESCLTIKRMKTEREGGGGVTDG